VCVCAFIRGGGYGPLCKRHEYNTQLVLYALFAERRAFNSQSSSHRAVVHWELLLVFFLSARRMTFSIQQTHINISSNTPSVYFFFKKGDLEEQVNFNICISSNPNAVILCHLGETLYSINYAPPFGRYTVDHKKSLKIPKW
jgi:hypothetical protein